MDIEMSLDDIIQKKRIRLNKPIRKGGRFRGRQFRRNENSNVRSNTKSNGNFSAKTRGGISKGGGSGRRPNVVEDARFKIIQKTRQKITDAREKLVEIAKQSGDARLKLKKMQEKRMKSGGRQRRRGGGGGPPLILRSVNPSIVEPTITIGDDSDKDDDDDVPVLRRTVNNSISISRLGAGGVHDIQIADDDDMLTDDNDKMYSTWSSSRPITSRLLQQPPTQLKIVTHNEQLLQGRMEDEWEYRLPAAQNLLDRQSGLPKKPYGVSRLYRGTGYDDEDQFRSHRNSRISQEMKARLDTPGTPTSRSMGVLSQPSLPPSQPVGHRIVVSNLQPSVTHEDIKELFEDIGPLVASHVVRPGTAEVTYVHQKDAVAAVDAYHNRQLDGQPMKCLLVPSRPTTLSSARVGAKYPSSTKSAVLPDISAIHKALFNK